MAYENISVKIIALELLFRTKFTMITKLGWIYKDQIVTYAIKKWFLCLEHLIIYLQHSKITF